MSHGHDHADPIITDLEARAKAIEAALVARGLVSTDAIDEVIEAYEERIGPHVGAAMVARIWTDPEFRERALADGTAALAEMGGGGAEAHALVCLENTGHVHNAVVCTLCSCYPWPVLGLPPTWYKSAAYRSRMVAEPRSVLEEFGTELGDDVEIRIHDSTAEVRYLVIPQRPAGTEGWTAEQLAEIVTRDSMVGVTRLEAPAGAPA